MSLLRPGLDSSLMELVEEAGRNVQRSGLLMRELLADFPEHAPLARDLKVCEQEGDRITHDIIHRLTAGRRVRAPFAASDGYALATALDDIVDYTEHAAAQMVLYGVEAPMEQAVEFAEVLVGAGEQIARALRCLRTGTRAGPPPGGDPSPGERGRPPAARRRRLAVRGWHRPDGCDPLEGHLRVAGGRRRRLRDGRPRAGGDRAQAARAVAVGAAELFA